MDYLKNPSQDFKSSFCFEFLGVPGNAKLKAKLERSHILRVQSGKITVWEETVLEEITSISNHKPKM